MLKYFSKIFNKLNSLKSYLLVANILLTVFLIIFANSGMLPFKNFSDLVFFSFLFFAFALYRPGWAFLFFTGAIALENVNLAPKEIELMLRPYQFIGALTIMAVFIRFSAKRLNFQLPRINKFDIGIIIFTISGFLSAFGAENKTASLKFSIIIFSFAILYFLSRIFMQTIDDLKKIIPFSLSSGIVVIFYGIWQNIRFIQNSTSFEIMPGRPNSTFTEPDWLGIYLVMLLAILYSIIYFLNSKSQDMGSRQIQSAAADKIQIPKNLLFIFYFLFLAPMYILLIITVSRSAWLGAFIVTFIFLFIIWTALKLNPKYWQWKTVLQIKIPILLSLIFSIVVVYIFNLTSFQLFNRLESTSTGLQKITVSCQNNVTLPEKIGYSEELIRYGCRHINLEEIKLEEMRGNFIKETYRNDPNVNIRSRIYQKSWIEIKKHPLLGIGWGNIGYVLGNDENGNKLNSSNIFLEVWLGSGILGITAFVLIWIFIIIKAVRFFSNNNPGVKTFGLFLFLGFFAVIIPNLFNAGVMLGILWLFFGIANIEIENN